MKMNGQFMSLAPYPGGCTINLWNDRRDGKWKTWEECSKGEGVSYGDFVPMRSYRAARRHLKKHDEIPVGTKFKLASRWVGFDRVMVKR